MNFINLSHAQSPSVRDNIHRETIFRSTRIEFSSLHLNYDDKFVKGNRNQYLYSAGRYLLDNQLSTTEVRNTLGWMNSLKHSLKESELNSTIMRSLKI